MKKILVIRFSSIGDIVLTSPVIRCLKKQLRAEVHFLTKQNYHSILKANPYLDKIYTIKKEITELIPALKRERYDYIVDLHKNLRSLHLRVRLGVKTYAFNKINFQKWLMVRFKINRLPNQHIVDRYMNTVRPLGVENDGKGLDYFIPPEDMLNAKDIFSSRINNPQSQNLHLAPPTPEGKSLPQLESSDQHPVFLIFVIGAAHNTKRLPTEKIIAVCQKITLPIVLLGGPGESKEGTYIAKETGDHVINTCGNLNLNQSASLVQQATKVITHDTGMMHIAAAFQKEIISIWGNTIPEFGMYPYYPNEMARNTTMQIPGLSCRPCSKIGFKNCPKGHFRCMKDIEEDDVITSLKLD